jgi:biopolymer transport protein ExbB/TolQ
MASGVIVVLAFAAIGLLAAALAVAAYRRAGARDSSARVSSRRGDHPLSLPHDIRPWRF